MLVGTACRYIAGRAAVQTVYWRTGSKPGDLPKLVKTGKVLSFGEKMPASLQESLNKLGGAAGKNA